MVSRRILVTGNTGFTGNWLVPQLLSKGYEVHGLSDKKAGANNLFSHEELECLLETTLGDVRNLKVLQETSTRFKPDFIVHLAAQPLVIQGYRDPAHTFSVNVLGTLNVLEVALRSPSVKGVLAITSDKVYKPTSEIVTEVSPLLGDDPYSASKSASENVISGYRRLFEKEGKSLFSIRGGNIIGGGDYSPNRVVPDLVRAWQSGNNLILRNPKFVRPWQHVLDLTRSYVLALEGMASETFVYEALNVGPSVNDSLKTVQDVVEELRRSGLHVALDQQVPIFHESSILRISSEKAKVRIGWEPTLGFEDACRLTGEWYVRVLKEGEHPLDATQDQIKSVSKMAFGRA